MKTHIVIPIGVAAPGTPLPHLLIKSIDSILNQTNKDFILTVAADTDISDEAKKILEDKQVNVKWFSPHSFFAKGGIWKKVSDTWRDVDSKYVAFLHYDDLWDSEKLQHQVADMENNNLFGSWSETYVIDANDKVLSPDYSHWSHFSSGTIGSKTTAFAHSVIVNKDEFFKCGITKYDEKWSSCFEDLFTLYLHKIGQMRKTPNAKFFWRSHDMNMSSTLCLWAQPNSMWKDMVDAQRVAVDYPNNSVASDYNFIMSDMKEDMKIIQSKY